MTTRIAIVAATLWLAASGNAFAQSARDGSTAGRPVRIAGDSLDPLSQGLAAAAAVRVPARTVTASRPATSAEQAYAIYMRQYNQYLADYAQFQRESAKSGPGFFEVLNGISAGLQVADQAVDLYRNVVVTRQIAEGRR